MSALLLLGDNVLRLPSARVARGDVQALRNTANLLDEAQQIRSRAGEDAAVARQNAVADGREEALGEMREALNAALAELTAGLEAEDRRREAEVAEAAMSVVRQLIDREADADIVTGLARGALRRLSQQVVTVAVHPDYQPAVAAALSDRSGVVVEGDAGLPLLGCRLSTADGRVIADLDRQMGALAARWGLMQGMTGEGGDA